MKLVDLDELENKLLCANYYDNRDEDVFWELVESLDSISPETLPIVKKLRKQIKEYETKTKEVVVHAEWVEEHPNKTRKQDFLEKFPHAQVYRNGTPKSCCEFVGYKVDCSWNCEKCWNELV